MLFRAVLTNKCVQWKAADFTHLATVVATVTFSFINTLPVCIKLTKKEASTVVCSVVKHAGSCDSTKEE